MIKKLNIKKILILSISITIIVYVVVNSLIGDEKYEKIKSFLNLSIEQKEFIKKYIFPQKYISQKERKIAELQKTIDLFYPKLELDKKKSGSDIVIKESTIKLSNNLTLRKYDLTSGFYAGINNVFPGSGYIEFFEKNIFILSSRGILAFRENLNDDRETFKQIKNNINEFIGLEQFGKRKTFSLKDLFILKNKIFVSYTEEIKKDCWNTSVIIGEINYENITFRKLFSPKKCIHSIDDSNDIDKFTRVQSGGRIISLDNKHILLSIGEYRIRHLAQNKQSVNGKIIKLNIDTSDYEIFSMGHRNPQGLYFDEENNFIIETEHGPNGGDEINLIEVNRINKDKIPNYGWAISSAGDHYGGKTFKNRKKYEKYPLYKSHSDYGFIEPLHSFVPSIGISEIVKIGQDKYVTSSMKDKSLYFFELNEQREIINLDRIEVFERVRDLRFNNNQLYLFMEDTASIGIINIS